MLRLRNCTFSNVIFEFLTSKHCICQVIFSNTTVYWRLTTSLITIKTLRLIHHTCCKCNILFHQNRWIIKYVVQRTFAAADEPATVFELIELIFLVKACPEFMCLFYIFVSMNRFIYIVVFLQVSTSEKLW